ncbi:tyrosine-type recombinase/integrase [Owenweeksia hongkongensis]|uniref:tyrosine-type recombinase/integrase n=1 Tax=Owenweeksia hongkongensis TaxID=253245 RepID=UPI003A8D5DB4
MISDSYNRVSCEPSCHKNYLKAFLQVNGKRLYFTTGCKMKTPKNGKKGKCLQPYMQPLEVEIYERLRSSLVSNTYRILNEGGHITRQSLLDSMSRKSSNFLADLERFVEYKKKLVSTETIRSSYAPLLNHMKKFNPSHYNQQVHQEFYLYLADECGLSDTSIGKYFKKLKEFFSHSYSNIDNTYIKVHDAPKAVVSLTQAELSEIHKQPRTASRDLFLCMAYTGLRHSDSQLVTEDMIEGNTLPYIQLKTGSLAIAPVNDFVRETFKLYDGKLPQVTNQVTNRVIKNIGKEMKLDRLVLVNHFYKGKNRQTKEPLHTQLTCQVARKTFITLSLEQGIPQPIVMQLTGHKKVDTVMRHYTGSMSDGIMEASLALQKKFNENRRKK